MGFEEDVRSILSQTPPARQTLLFTATWPRAVQRLAEEFGEAAATRRQSLRRLPDTHSCPSRSPAAPKTVQITLGDTDVLVANPSVTQARL